MEDLIKIAEAIKAKKCIAFIGAGVSSNPKAKELLEYLKNERTYLSKEIKTIEEASFIIREKEGTNGLFKLLKRNLSSENFSEAQKLLADIDFKGYVSMNFDTLLEDALKFNDKEFKVIKKDEDLAELDPNQVFVIKPHGCLSDKRTIRIASDDTLNLNEEIPLINRYLSNLFVNHVFLFIGFSFKDFDILLPYSEQMRFVKQANNNKYPFMNFAIMKTDIDYKKRFLSKYGINVIDKEADEYLLCLKELLKINLKGTPIFKDEELFGIKLLGAINKASELQIKRHIISCINEKMQNMLSLKATEDSLIQAIDEVLDGEKTEINKIFQNAENEEIRIKIEAIIEVVKEYKNKIDELANKKIQLQRLQLQGVSEEKLKEHEFKKKKLKLDVDSLEIKEKELINIIRAEKEELIKLFEDNRNNIKIHTQQTLKIALTTICEKRKKIYTGLEDWAFESNKELKETFISKIENVKLFGGNDEIYKQLSFKNIRINDIYGNALTEKKDESSDELPYVTSFIKKIDAKIDAINKNANNQRDLYILLYSQSQTIIYLLSKILEEKQRKIHLLICECGIRSINSFEHAIEMTKNIRFSNVDNIGKKDEDLKLSEYKISIIPDIDVFRYINNGLVDMVLFGAHKVIMEYDKNYGKQGYKIHAIVNPRGTNSIIESVIAKNKASVNPQETISSIGSLIAKYNASVNPQETISNIGNNNIDIYFVYNNIDLSKKIVDECNKCSDYQVQGCNKKFDKSDIMETQLSRHIGDRITQEFNIIKKNRQQDIKKDEENYLEINNKNGEKRIKNENEDDRKNIIEEFGYDIYYLDENCKNKSSESK